MFVNLSPQRDITSIGSLAGQLQISVRTIEKLAVELGIEPSFRINGVPHFDGEQVERIFKHNQQRDENHV